MKSLSIVSFVVGFVLMCSVVGSVWAGCQRTCYNTMGTHYCERSCW